MDAVEVALQILNDNELFHHQKLLADGLAAFTGDKDELAERLWRHVDTWNSNLMVSIVQFITISSEKYREIFLPVMDSTQTDIELRLVLLRYYRRHLYAPVKEVLLKYLYADMDLSLCIVSASVLERYPGDNTVAALTQALGSSNWYVRRNAAASLQYLDVDLKKLQVGLKDRYAKDILTYMMAEKEMRSNESVC